MAPAPKNKQQRVNWRRWIIRGKNHAQATKISQSNKASRRG